VSEREAILATKKRPAKKKRTAHFVELEHANGIASFHCPVCGEGVVSAEEGICEQRCKHVILIHDWMGEWLPRDARIEQLIEKAVARAAKIDGYAIEILRSYFEQNVVFFEFFVPGHASMPPSVLTAVVDMGMEGPV
jgi:endogenous inhibitor of DNA gyrase (YacG/DUF329 family)